MKPAETLPFDPVEFLNDEETCAFYLTAAMESGDPAIIADAMGVVARARGMTQLANATGLSRENLYRSLASGGNPEFSTVVKVMAAMGLKLAVTANTVTANETKAKAKRQAKTKKRMPKVKFDPDGRLETTGFESKPRAEPATLATRRKVV